MPEAIVKSVRIKRIDQQASRAPISPTGRPSPTLSGWSLWKKSDPNTTGGNSMLSKDFREFIELLNSNKVSILEMLTKAESQSKSMALLPTSSTWKT